MTLCSTQRTTEKRKWDSEKIYLLERAISAACTNRKPGEDRELQGSYWGLKETEETDPRMTRPTSPIVTGKYLYNKRFLVWL